MRVALLDLLAETGTVTSTEAAGRLGYSSGLCSFHLRQLARHGLIEEVPHSSGRARPWRLRWDEPRSEPAEFDLLARGLEDESYQRWLSAREPGDDRDDAFSMVLNLTPQDVAEVGRSLRRVLAAYEGKKGAQATATVIRLFPLLPE